MDARVNFKIVIREDLRETPESAPLRVRQQQLQESLVLEYA
jgi:hypothetical protein